MNSELKKLSLTAMRRLVETLERDRLLLENLLESGNEEVVTLSIRHKDGYINVKLTTSWLSDLFQRFESLKFFGTDLAEELSLKDLERDFETASRVVLLLWSSLETTWNLNKKENYEDLVVSVIFYAPMCGWDQPFIPYLKYQLSWLFAKGEAQEELPIKTRIYQNDGIVLLGWTGRFFKSRVFGTKLKNLEWRNTVLHGIKKGLPKMDRFLLARNKEAMIKRLCPEDYKETPDVLLKAIHRTGREIFPKGIVFEDWERVNLYTGISDHCSYEMNRGNRGNIGFLLSEYEELSEVQFPGAKRPVYVRWGTVLCPHVLGAMYYNPRRGITGEVRYPGFDLVSEYKELRTQAFNSEEKGRALVKPIFEPLKVRMITAGDILTNGLFSNLQKKLWSQLQIYKQFSLTGKVVTNMDIEDVHDHSKVTDPSFKLWVSGDYSAATDNLNRDASLAAIQAISGDPITFKTLQKGLMDTYLDFSKCGENEEGMQDDELYEMRNGQLMGCVFSFPILCLINLAVYRLALETYLGYKIDISDLPVRVNGDDIIFCANKSLIKIWEDLIKGVGFEKSVGKNYVSPNFVVINSTYFDVRNPCNIYQVPYVNMGWISGERKCGLEALDGKIDALSDIWAIKDQVAQTKENFCTSGKFPCTQRDLFRRLDLFQRFKTQLVYTRFDTIKNYGYSMVESPLGLDLIDLEEGDLEEDNYRSREFFSSLYQLKKLEMTPSFGIPKFPRTLVPWKLVGIDADDSAFDFGKMTELRRLRSRYFGKTKRMSPFRLKNFNTQLLNYYQEREYRKLRGEYTDQYITLGELIH